MKRLPGCEGSNNSTHHEVVTRVWRDDHEAHLANNSTASPWMPSTSSALPMDRTGGSTAPQRGEIHIHSGCCPDLLVQVRRSCLSSAACSRSELLVDRHCGRTPPPSSCDSGWDKMHKRKRSDNVAAALAVNTVTVVVRPLIHWSAIVHVVLVPHSVPQEATQREAGKTCLERVLTKLAVQSSPRCRAPAGRSSRGTGRAACRCCPSHL